MEAKHYRSSSYTRHETVHNKIFIIHSAMDFCNLGDKDKLKCWWFLNTKCKTDVVAHSEIYILLVYHRTFFWATFRYKRKLNYRSQYVWRHLAVVPRPHDTIEADTGLSQSVCDLGRRTTVTECATSSVSSLTEQSPLWIIYWPNLFRITFSEGHLTFSDEHWQERCCLWEAYSR
jgi:hypothetical protein